MFRNNSKRSKNNYTDIIGLENSSDIRFSHSNDFLIPLTRALLCFLLTFGSICGYVSCFTTEFDARTVGLFLLVFSLIIAFVRNLSSKFLKNACYLGFLFLFAHFIFRYYLYVNSGYHAVGNITYAALENYLQIPALIYYEEIIEDSFLTITYFLIFLGIFELLLFHMWISEYVNLLTIFLIGLGPFVVPFFMNLYPEAIYVVSLMTAYIAFFLISLSCHTKTYPRKGRNYAVYFKRHPMHSKGKGFCYGTNGLTYFMTSIFSFILALCIWGLLQICFPYTSYRNYERESVLKQEVTDEVKYLVTFGLSGYFNRYNSVGGLSDGSLGGIYSVRPDYETDLTVTYVPLSSNTIYLRGYVGIGYTDRQWLNIKQLYDLQLISKEQAELFAKDVNLATEYSSLEMKSSYEPLRMDVKNVGADIRYDYSPYYTDSALLSDPFTQTKFYRNHSYNYYPENLYQSSVRYDMSDGNMDMLNACLYVPSVTREEIIQFLVTNDLCTQYIENTTTYKGYSGAELLQIINQVSNTLSSDFVYSLNPGITPRDEDYVGYFLNDKKTGFCAHFATSAALIFRTLGIPTRYVEGYVLTNEELKNASLAEGSVLSDYIDDRLVHDYSLSSTDAPLSVVNVDIADDKAHAWLEYYDPDFGWRVFEATTASLEDISTSDFWASLYGLLSRTGGADDTDAEVQNIEVISDSISSMLLRLLTALAIILAIGVLLYLSYKYTLQYRSYHRNRRNINLRNYYKIICKKVAKRYPEFLYILSMTDQLLFIQSHYQLSKKVTDSAIVKLSSLLERAAFSRNELSVMEYNYAFTLLKLIRRNITFYF